ncbi:Fructokinase [Arcticibacter svalbardensis MN12-7]|uniref:Fructokinase n=1 Tax=Arcticibacter svalbardensis MN12-7 TaxID=1150600 RepID=R9GYZ4_9SPHI|nr:PfkB family carbohydrate kinase [Arcticibacter svalbardensis]EOR96700.1 Fructokinase [Arcticibacter svalbardensis MN12-7]
MLLTKGSKGALHYNLEAQHIFPSIPVTVNDTVGSGDSFLAGYLAQLIKGSTLEKSMLNATALGAFITSKIGACPAYDLSEFEKFKLDKGVFTADY